MPPIAYPERLLDPELEARSLGANRPALALSVPSGGVSAILNGSRWTTIDTAVRLSRHFGNPPRFLLELQAQ